MFWYVLMLGRRGQVSVLKPTCGGGAVKLDRDSRTGQGQEAMTIATFQARERERERERKVLNDLSALSSSFVFSNGAHEECYEHGILRSRPCRMRNVSRCAGPPRRAAPHGACDIDAREG
jgi:hypothetical protein